MVNQTDNNTDLFAVVGAGYRIYEPPKRKRTFREKLKGKPIFSAVILLLIVLGCVFAPIFANHDPAGFYLDSLNIAPNSEFYFGTDSLGRDLYSIMWTHITDHRYFGGGNYCRDRYDLRLYQRHIT